jgi:hypothetical protein
MSRSYTSYKGALILLLCVCIPALPARGKDFKLTMVGLAFQPLHILIALAAYCNYVFADSNPEPTLSRSDALAIFFFGGSTLCSVISSAVLYRVSRGTPPKNDENTLLQSSATISGAPLSDDAIINMQPLLSSTSSSRLLGHANLNTQH